MEIKETDIICNDCGRKIVEIHRTHVNNRFGLWAYYCGCDSQPAFINPEPNTMTPQQAQDYAEKELALSPPAHSAIVLEMPVRHYDRIASLAQENKTTVQKIVLAALNAYSLGQFLEDVDSGKFK